MKKLTHGIILAITMLALSSFTMAEPFDGGKVMLCASQYAHECDAGNDCETVTVASVNLPDFFLVDTGKKLISATPESGSTSTTTIERVEHLDGKLMLVRSTRAPPQRPAAERLLDVVLQIRHYTHGKWTNDPRMNEMVNAICDARMDIVENYRRN